MYSAMGRSSSPAMGLGSSGSPPAPGGSADAGESLDPAQARTPAGQHDGQKPAPGPGRTAATRYRPATCADRGDGTAGPSPARACGVAPGLQLATNTSASLAKIALDTGHCPVFL